MGKERPLDLGQGAHQEAESGSLYRQWSLLLCKLDGNAPGQHRGERLPFADRGADRRRAARGGWIVGRDAILACADQVRVEVPPSTAGFLTGFAFKLGARRALDYAAFLKPHDGELAALKRNQAELFGQCHMCAIRADWPALAERLGALADVETAFRTTLLAQ